MDKRDLTVIENTQITEKIEKKSSRQTNPIAKKFVEFHNEHKNFSVKELFKR